MPMPAWPQGQKRPERTPNSLARTVLARELKKVEGCLAGRFVHNARARTPEELRTLKALITERNRLRYELGLR